MGFWEPIIVTFKFLDFEITPTLKEFCSLTELPIRGRLSMISSTISTGDFLSLFDLHIFRRRKIVYAGVLRLAKYCESYGLSKCSRALGVCRQQTD
ncbi:hypothetical protein H5410_030907 [Solanum commersonii]|uniref:Uncharacterized protein n=1 Tax=Solanum commersonii TaxID=4109 RepID=A0A9J5YH00_SOLCO|nr:hypothetical protein H5410_030907 [Solanum commersonii]